MGGACLLNGQYRPLHKALHLTYIFYFSNVPRQNSFLKFILHGEAFSRLKVNPIVMLSGRTVLGNKT